jgi:Icc-related predicted phosphoesterase
MEKLKVVLLSDTHARLSEIEVPNGDLLIHCGDFGFSGAVEEWKKFLCDFHVLPHRYKIFTFGNHDCRNENNLSLVKQEAADLGITLLVNETVEIEGLKIYGSPYTKRYGNWYWMKDEGEEIQRIWEQIPEGLDILFTHGQPYGVLDIAERTMEHVGDKDLRNAILEKTPKIVVGGHLHYQGGQSKEEFGIKFYNASVCDESYRATNKIHVIEIDKVPTP